MVMGYKVMPYFTMYTDFPLRVCRHSSLEPTLRGRTGFSHLLFPMVWQLAWHHLLLLKHLTSDKGSNPNRRRHEYTKIKLRPPQRRKSHDSCYWVPTAVCMIPCFSGRTIVYLLGYKHSLAAGPRVRELQQPQVYQRTTSGQLHTLPGWHLFEIVEI